MQPLGNLSRHLHLVKRMARATGTALDTSVQDGQLSISDWADAITRCRGCARVAECENWLSEAELSLSGPRPAPLACENRDLFRSLAPLAAE